MSNTVLPSPESDLVAHLHIAYIVILFKHTFSEVFINHSFMSNAGDSLGDFS